MRLRYIGRGPVTLMTLGLEVESGSEIEIPDEVGAQFADRPDFERLDAPAGHADADPSAETGHAEAEQPQAAGATGKRKTKAAGDTADQTTDTASAA